MKHFDPFEHYSEDSSCIFSQNSVPLTETSSFSPYEEMLDPFALVKDEVSEISNRLRSTVVSEVHALNCTPILNYTVRAVRFVALLTLYLQHGS